MTTDQKSPDEPVEEILEEWLSSVKNWGIEAYGSSATNRLAEALRRAIKERDEALSFKGKRDRQLQAEDAKNNEAFILGFEAREWDSLRAKLAIAMEALAVIADCPHAGQGFCYEPHGTRKCSCHVADAREALAKINAGDIEFTKIEYGRGPKDGK
jgi:hypothetical protein